MEKTFKMIKVIDNFLDEYTFNEMKEMILGRTFPWYHFDQPVDNYSQWDWDKTPQEIKKEVKRVDGQFFMVHSLFDNQKMEPYNTKDVFNIIKPITSKLKMKELIRVKINSYPNQGKLVEHTWHIDTDYTHKGCLLAFNTCNGYTKFKDGDKIDKVESVANRAILFDPSKLHTSSNTTNAPRRVNININYFEL